MSALCAAIETNGEDTWAELPEPLTYSAQLDPARVRERIRWAGVVGMGGAPPSRPASNSVQEPTGKSQTLVINGAECEPYIACDDRLMREHAGRILEFPIALKNLIDKRVKRRVAARKATAAIGVNPAG